MKINFLSLSVVVMMVLGISLASAQERNGQAKAMESLKFWPNEHATSTKPQSPAQDEVLGSVAHVLAYVEDQHSEEAVASRPKLMILYPTSSGAVVVRFLELPEGLGLHGPF